MVLAMLTACGTKKSDFFKTINQSEKNHIRGVEIGMDIKEVKKMENNEFLLDDMPQYLHYDYEINMGNSYTVTYDFFENELSNFICLEDKRNRFKNVFLSEIGMKYEL